MRTGDAEADKGLHEERPGRLITSISASNPTKHINSVPAYTPALQPLNMINNHTAAVSIPHYEVCGCGMLSKQFLV